MVGSDIGKLITEYCSSMDRQEELNKALFKKLPKKEWIGQLDARARELTQIAARDEQILGEIGNLLSKDLSEEESLYLYNRVVEMYNGDYDDYVVIFPLLNKLREIYEDTCDYEKLVFIYKALFYEICEIRNRGSGQMRMSDEYLEKIFALCDHYSEFSPEARRGVWVAWYNYVVIDTENPDFDINRSYLRHKKANEFWNSDVVQALDKDNESILEIIDIMNKDWMCVEEHIEDANDEVKKYLYDYSGKLYAENVATAKSITDYNDRVYALYLRTRIESGEETFSGALDKYLEYYKACLIKFESAGKQSVEEQHFLNNGPLYMLRLAEHIEDRDKADRTISYLLKSSKKNLFTKYKDFPSQFINDVLAKWCYKTLGYLGSRKEKEDYILDLIVKRQLPTYLHSVIVSELAAVFAESALIYMPEFFCELPVKEDIPEYLRNCGLFHDVGKTRIADIINLQCRKLGDEEFDSIKKHPEYGAKFMENDPDLIIYRDVAAGHHCYYDGSGGYPDDYDHDTPYRAAIDIITICDCLDAATDQYGRNYKKAKTPDEIFEELKKYSGTRYNPELVKLLDLDPDLKSRIGYFIGAGRADIMYQAYRKKI